MPGYPKSMSSSRRGSSPKSSRAKSGSSRPLRQGKKNVPASNAQRTPKKKTQPAPPEPVRTGVFRLGYVAGATPGKWIKTWRDRYPGVELELIPLESADSAAALREGSVDIAILREPFDHAGLGAIALYDEVVGAVVSIDSALESVTELEFADLAGEVVIVPQDDAVHLGAIADTIAPRFSAPERTEDAIATVATGVGVVIVPMSIARLHRRKDVTFRPLVGAKPTSVMLAWPEDKDSPDVQAFIGIVRGRTAQSSRD